MRVICSYCRKSMPDKEPLGDDAVSHGICPPCFDNYMAQLEGLSTSEYLGRLEAPVLVMNADGRVVAANDAALAMTGRTHADLGLRSGEFLACTYARLPEGCGQTTHCGACAIRRTVNAALAGAGGTDLPVSLRKPEEVVEMRVSAHRIGDVVQVVVERSARK